VIGEFGLSTSTMGGTPDENGDYILRVQIPDENSLDTAFTTLTDPSGTIAGHTTDFGPKWAACSNPELEARLCNHYGCPSKTVSGIND